MPILNPRNRIIVFRVTSDEYETLQGACESAGGRTLSEYTRSELLSRLDTDPVLHRFGAIEKRLAEIQIQIQELFALFASEPALAPTVDRTGSDWK